MKIAAWNHSTVGAFPLAEFVISMRMAREWSVLPRGSALWCRQQNPIGTSAVIISTPSK